jgi:NADH dehydrogenase
MVFTGGIKASKLNATLDVAKNRMDQFIADAYLHIASKENVFALGDCVELRDNKGQMLPPTAQSAERSAEYVAHAIRAKIDGKKVAPFSASMMGMFIALGGKYAVGEMFGVIKVKGYMAFLLKKAITHVYYLGLRLRINVGYKNRGNSNNS